MYVAACSPTSSIFSEMLELNALRYSSKKEVFEGEMFDGKSYDASKCSPVFVGRYGHKLGDAEDFDDVGSTRSSLLPDYDPATTHPATYGYVLLDKKPPVTKEEPILPNPKECNPREYLETYIFPILLPAMEKMLVAAKENKVFERRRTKFNACDFLTEYLYKNNPCFKDRERLSLLDIPFVERILAKNPRTPLPLSLLLSDEEAAIIIQSFYRGYCVRKRPDVQELREYQREMRNEAVDIFLKVEDFWKKHPIDDSLDDEVTIRMEGTDALTSPTRTETVSPQ
ncbi:IQ domain-containing protein K-like [Actinia tenebrosa]|uniref:IQ domain-containing protein K-like n=1 Tax=Actinia tenebrosa TaxID=6105 RepID=A0A6P8HGH9_ACTTE|nr:IQ domain-containing protein K-like [Actinia tenebrosa]